MSLHGFRRGDFHHGTVAMVVAMLSAGPALASEKSFGVGDSIALDQPRLTIAFQRDGVTTPPDDLGYTFIADTGATGVLIAAGGHFDYDQLAFDSDLYDLDADYFEQGVGGFELVGVTAEYDLLAAPYLGFGGFFGGGATQAPGDGETKTIPGVRALTNDGLNIGSYDGIVGMPGFVGKALIADLTNMTPLDTIAVDLAAAAPAPATGATTYNFSLGKLAFDPAAGQVHPDDPLPSSAPLPTLEGVGMGRNEMHTSGTALVDTGAQLTIATSAFLSDIGIDPVADAIDHLPVGGVGGNVLMPIVQIDRLVLPSDEGVDLVFEQLAVGVLDIEGLPVDVILGFNAFTTGYLAGILAALQGELGEELPDHDGAFLDVLFDFTGGVDGDWSMRLTENPDYIPQDPNLIDDGEFLSLSDAGLGLQEQALFAWPAFTIPEPGTALLLLPAGGWLLTRRQRESPVR